MSQILEALNQLTRERRVDKELLFETLEIGLTSAIKKKYGNNAVVDVVVDEDTGQLQPFLVKTVVEDENEIEDPICQIALEDAQLDDPKLKVGDEVRELLPFSEFGRNAIALAKQVLVQRVREVERGKIFDEFKDRVGEVVTGTVQQQDRTGVLVSLGKAEAFLPRRESIRRERWHQGLPIKAFVVEVLDVTKGPQIILSRTHPGLIEKLFESEVPEIYDGIVEVKAVARDAGGRSKIAVLSHDERVDAVGACVGMKGSRVQSVVKELSGERVDIVPWSDEAQQFVTKALSPARVQSMRVDRDRQEMAVVVDDDQLSLAIGREGQNVRLAVRLTGWRIDLVSSSEMGQRERLDRDLRIALDDVEGLDPEHVTLLQRAGLHNLKDLNAAAPETLQAIEGLSEEDIETVLAVAAQREEEIKQAFSEQLESESQLFDEEKFDRVPGVETGSTLTFSEEVPDDEDDSPDAAAEAGTEEAIEADTEATEPAAGVEEAAEEEAPADAAERAESSEAATEAVETQDAEDDRRRQGAAVSGQGSDGDDVVEDTDEEPTEPKTEG